MTDIRVLSRDEVEISGTRWCRDNVKSWIGDATNDPVLILGWREILRLMDAYEEPAPKWEPGMWVKFHNPEISEEPTIFQIGTVKDGWLRDRRGQGFGMAWCEPVPPPKEEKLSQEMRCLVTGNMCGSDTWAVGHECPCDSCRRWLLAHRAVETSDKPENPFTGPHWQEDNFTKDIVFNAWRRDCDLRDELTRIRQLLVGKSVTP